MNTISRKILEAGVQAPSGGNSQPWRFEVSGNTIAIYMLPERDHPILNFRNRGTILAIGCLIENISVASIHYALKADINLFPDKNKNNYVANIVLKEGDGKEDIPIFNAIWKRATNRKPYKTEKLDEKIKQELLAVPGELGQYDIDLILADDTKQIQTLAKAASANEIVMFENKKLHQLFFKEIVWTEDEEKEKKSGLYLKTMELKPPQVTALKMLFKHWPVMNLLNKLDVTRGIADGNAKGYAACGAYGAVLCRNKDEDFIGVGRVIERAWLKAVAAGLSFHLQTGVNFLWQGIQNEKQNIFSSDHTRLIREQYAEIEDVFKGKNKLIPAIFRIGYDREPSGRSSRKMPEITYVA